MSENGNERPPDFDETPVTVSQIRELIEAHPDYRLTKHMTQGGHKFTLIEIPNGDEEYLEGSSGEFVSWVSELEESLQADTNHSEVGDA